MRKKAAKILKLLQEEKHETINGGFECGRKKLKKLKDESMMKIKK